MPGVLDCATTACDIINIGSLVKLDGFRIPFTILEYSYIDDRMVSLVLYSVEEGIRYTSPGAYHRSDVVPVICIDHII